jgi:RHS repeat-associated protein
MNLGYTGKPYDSVTGLYDYGFRDYQPVVARFTTVDPVRDGNNWFSYVNNDPVNFLDLWGLDVTNDTDHVQYVRMENGKTVPIQPHETIPGRIDGVMTQDGQTYKISDSNKSPFAPMHIIIGQNPNGSYSFEMSAWDLYKNTIGDIIKLLMGRKDISGIFPDQAEGQEAGKWWDKIRDDPSTWDNPELAPLPLDKPVPGGADEYGSSGNKNK